MRSERPVATATFAAVALVVFLVRSADAQPSNDEKFRALAAEIKKLQKGLTQRDAVIRELLMRVDKLEQVENQTTVRSRQAAVDNVAGARTSGPQDVEYRRTVESAAVQPAPTSDSAASPDSAPGQFSVSKEAAQHALERALVQTGALLLPPGKAEFVPSLVYQYNDVSRPYSLALTSSGSVLVTQSVLRDTVIEPQALFRVGLPWSSQAQLALPFEYQSLSNTTAAAGAGVSEQTQEAWGLADPSLTLTKQIAEEREWLPGLFLSGEYSANVGELRNGIQLGNGFNEFQFGLLAVKRQDPLVFTGGFVYQTALESRSIDLADEYMPSLGMLLAVNPETSVQFSQQVVFANKSRFNGQSIPGSELTKGIFTAGVLSTLGPRASVDFSVGVGETPDAPNLTFQLQFPIRLN